MRTFIYSELSKGQVLRLTKRPAINFTRTFEIVKPVINEIKSRGLKAALKYAKKFDGLDGNDFIATENEIRQAKKNIAPQIKKAVDSAYANIRKFHLKQLPASFEIETVRGVKCSREYRAIEDVALYIPGGTAVLPSTMLMLGVPAQIAGCKRVVVCSPAKDGKINEVLLYAAGKCGIKEFYKIGGAQAIALLAYGDKKIPGVSKILGPGNQYVTAAKLLVSIDPDGCAIDMPAGPSELLVIADETANPGFVAADLLSQAEHGTDSQVILVTDSRTFLKVVDAEIKKQLRSISRKEYAAVALKNSFTLLVNNIEEGINFSNLYAPEHLIINIKNSHKYKSKVKNAGSVFFGNFSPESAGDYASGTNHSLPTYGFAKTFGGVTVESFMKPVTFQSLSAEGLKNISETIMTLAETEDLTAHKKAVEIRLRK